MECSRNDGSKTQYYIVILNQLQGLSGRLERAPESQIRGPLTSCAQLPLQLAPSISKCPSPLGLEFPSRERFGGFLEGKEDDLEN